MKEKLSKKKQSVPFIDDEKGYSGIILDSIADGLFTVDPDFRIIYVNRAAKEILGITEEEAIGKYCYEVFHANICEHSCALKETMKTGRNIVNKTVYIVNNNGDKIPISISSALLKDEFGEVIGGVESFRDISDLVELRKEIESKYTFEDIISKNSNLMDIFSILPDIAESDSSVIIEGESGTGKELVARAIHNLSTREAAPMIIVNCAAIPETLIESELFGHKAGAFTDARKDKPGKIALAETGTLFLDEIGELAPAVQVKLLRFLQEKTYEPLGGVRAEKADVRILAATNRVLADEVREGRFRDDLYYRLNVVNLTLPPLRDRREDIPLLVRHFIRRFNIVKGRNIEEVSDKTMNILMNYGFPGNIRELENIIEHAFVLCKDAIIQSVHLPAYVRGKDRGKNESAAITLEEMEKLHILRTLEKNDWHRSKTSEDLAINKSTLWRKMQQYEIE